MTTTIKAASAADFLGMVPALLGYVPTESVVLVLFKDNRTVGAMRVDVPRQGDDLHEYASTLTGYTVRKGDCNGVAAIVYTSRPHDERALAVLNALLVRLNDHGMRPVDLLYVAGDGWGSLMQGGAPHPLTDLVEHPDAPPVQAGNQAASAQLPTINEAYAADVMSYVGTWAPDDATELLDLFELVTKDGRMLAHHAGRVIDVLDKPALRDIGLVQWTGDYARGELALEAQLAWEEGVEYPADLAMVMWGEGPRPDVTRLEHVRATMRELAAICPTSGVLATLAWISWAFGRSTEADVYAEMALKANPEHGLAEIIRSFVNAGHLPQWAFEANDA